VTPIRRRRETGRRIGFFMGSVRSQNRAALAGQSGRADVVNHAMQSWKNGSVESINERLRDERLDQEQLDILWEVTVVMECWRHTDNGIRPHSTQMVSCAGAIAQAAIRLTHMAAGTTTRARSVLAILPAKFRIKPLQNTEHIQGPHQCPLAPQT
jgi:hypothetical protein